MLVIGGCITVFGIVALITGDADLAKMAMVALAGWLGGNANGQKEKITN